jgi:hypothetical protein
MLMLGKAAMSYRAAALTMALLSTPAESQGTIIQEGIKQQQTGSSYCETGFDWLASYKQASAPDHSTIYRLCAPGDSLMIPTAFASLIAKVCDFSQAVVSVPNFVICAVSPQRKIRTGRKVSQFIGRKQGVRGRAGSPSIARSGSSRAQAANAARIIARIDPAIASSHHTLTPTQTGSFKVVRSWRLLTFDRLARIPPTMVHGGAASSPLPIGERSDCGRLRAIRVRGRCAWPARS